MEERLCIYTAQEGHGVEMGRVALASELQRQTCRSTAIFVGVDQRPPPSERAKKSGPLWSPFTLRLGSWLIREAFDCNREQGSEQALGAVRQHSL